MMSMETTTMMSSPPEVAVATAGTVGQEDSESVSEQSHDAEEQNELTIRRRNHDKRSRIPVALDLFAMMPGAQKDVPNTLDPLRDSSAVSDNSVQEKGASANKEEVVVAAKYNVTSHGSIDKRIPNEKYDDSHQPKKWERELCNSRTYVDKLLREDDAALLDSLHEFYPSRADVAIETFGANSNNSVAPEHLLQVQQESTLRQLVSVNEAPQKSSFSWGNSRSVEASLEPKTSDYGLPLESSFENTLGAAKQRQVSCGGEIWITSNNDADRDEEAWLHDEFCLSLNEGVESSYLMANRDEFYWSDERRRRNEAAQFAEAVGGLPPDQQAQLQIIEDEPELDEDEDDDATEIRLEHLPLKINVAGKARPQWPYHGNQFLLDKLPTNGPLQDYEYKGIKCNPPEIVKRGITRGNYSQLHRKAWLEVSDKYHRYGKHLRLYYQHWEDLGCPIYMFFDWLDSKGEAVGQPLPELEVCPRSVLDSDTVMYISNPRVTAGYAILVAADERGRARMYDIDGDPVRTGPDGWIFVLRDGVMYGAQKITSISGHSKQRFHHSSFFAGKAVAAAGYIVTDDDGVLTRLYPHSGHYRPCEADLQRVLFHLHHEGIDLHTFEVDMQKIMHMARENDGPMTKKNKRETQQLLPAVIAACYLAHKARAFREKIHAQIHQIRWWADGGTSASETLALIKSNNRAQTMLERI